MKMIIKILIGLILLIVIVLIIGLFTRKNYTVKREITVNQPSQKVFNYIKFLKNQKFYSKWVMADPNVKSEYRGNDGYPGFVHAWEGNKKAGKGEQEIKDIKEGDRIETELRFIKPFEGLAFSYISVQKLSENQSKVQWGFDSKMNYPMNIMLLFVNMDNMLGKDLEESLVNLKTILEKPQQ